MPRRPATLALLCLVALVPLAACAKTSTPSGSAPATTADSDSDGGSAEAGSGYAIVSDAEVAAGLTTSTQLAMLAVKQLPTDQAAAKATTAQLYDGWASYEGTVRANDKSLYLDLEDGLGALKNGVDQNNLEKAQRGLADFTTASTSYLAKFPATGTATTATAAGASS